VVPVAVRFAVGSFITVPHHGWLRTFPLLHSVAHFVSFRLFFRVWILHGARVAVTRSFVARWLRYYGLYVVVTVLR